VPPTPGELSTPELEPNAGCGWDPGCSCSVGKIDSPARRQS